MNDMSHFVRRILAGSKTAPGQGTYTPALVVGLGGTGIRALRFLKNLLEQYKNNHVHLLGLDSDSGENEREWVVNLPRLDDSEMILLDATRGVSSLERAVAEHASDTHVLEYLPNEKGNHEEVKQRIGTQRGAGQFRRAGKLLFQSNVSGGGNVDHMLTDIRRQMTGLQAVIGRQAAGLRIDNVSKIYVVTSIAGGTGAGCLLDFLGLLRKHFNQPLDMITVFGVLPGPLLDNILQDPVNEMPQTRGNTVGLLRELQAVLQGRLQGHTFKFDQYNSYTIGASPLVNDVYLVDHHTYDRRLAKDYLDLCRGISCFIYSLVGTGLGASQDSGRVNGNIQGDWGDENIPRVFNAFGIGVVEYPVHEMLDYALRCYWDRWLGQWLGKSTGTASIHSSISTFVARENIDSVDRLRKQLQPDVRGARFYEEPALEKQLMGQRDEDFLRRGNSAVSGIDTELKLHHVEFEGLADQTAGRIIEAMRQEALKWTALGRGAALQGLAGLEKDLEEIKQAREQEEKNRADKIGKTQEKISKKARWVDIVDFGMDSHLRKQYIKLVREYLQLKLDDNTESYLADVLTLITNGFTQIKTDIENLGRSAETARTNNKEFINEILATNPDSCFVQSVITPSEFPAWEQGLNVEMPGQVTIASFQLEDLLAAALTPVLTDYQIRIQQLDIVAAANQSKEYLNRVRTTETASEPLADMVSTRLPRETMTPQKFVSSKIANPLDPFITANFKQVATRRVEALPIPEDKHRIACVQTIHGFGFDHWVGAETAVTHYRQREWRYHTFPVYDELPTLRKTGDDRSSALTHLGLGLAFELINCRGANYYKNFIYDTPEGVQYYRTFKASPNVGASAMLAADIIKMALKSKIRPESANLLGNSLEAALKKLGTTQETPFVEAMNEIAEDFIAKVGKQRVADLVRGFVEGELDLEIARAKDDRRKTLQEIADTLRAYAEQLS